MVLFGIVFLQLYCRPRETGNRTPRNVSGSSTSASSFFLKREQFQQPLFSFTDDDDDDDDDDASVDVASLYSHQEARSFNK